MMHRLQKFYHRTLLARYVAMGIITTLLDRAIFTLLFRMLGAQRAFSSIIAWMFAFLFAFLANKWIVFRSYGTGDTMNREILRFTGVRVLTLLLGEGLSVLAGNAAWHATLSFFAVGAVVATLNFLFSRLYVFAGLQVRRASPRYRRKAPFPNTHRASGGMRTPR